MSGGRAWRSGGPGRETETAPFLGGQFRCVIRPSSRSMLGVSLPKLTGQKWKTVQKRSVFPLRTAWSAHSHSRLYQNWSKTGPVSGGGIGSWSGFSSPPDRRLTGQKMQAVKNDLEAFNASAWDGVVCAFGPRRNRSWCKIRLVLMPAGPNLFFAHDGHRAVALAAVAVRRCRHRIPLRSARWSAG